MNEIIGAWSLALVHFLWQGCLIAVLLALFLQLARSRSANLRYTAGVVALALMCAMPVITFVYVLNSPAPAGQGIEQPRFADASSTQPSPAGPSDTTQSEGGETAAGTAGSGQASILALRAAFASLAAKLDNPLIRNALVGGWWVGVIALALMNTGGWWKLRRIRLTASPVDDAALLQRVRELCDRVGIRHAVQVLASREVDVPAVVGALRPVVLLPASALLGMPPQMLEALLLHELAHVRRHDYLVNLLQAAAESLLFYHPAVWWVSRQVRDEREHCCDDLAVSLCRRRHDYVRALVDMERLRIRDTAPLAVSAHGGSLVERIRRLTDSPSRNNVADARWVFGVAAAALAVLFFVAQAAAAPQSSTEPQASITPAVSSAPLQSAAPEASATPVMSIAPGQQGAEGIEGRYTAEPGRFGVHLQLRLEGGWGRSHMGISVDRDDLSMSREGGVSGFLLVRDAGTFRFSERLGEDKHRGRFVFHPNPSYVSDMQAIGFKVSDDPEKLFEMAALDVSLDFTRGIVDVGYGNISTNRLIEFRIHGVKSEFIQGMADAGYEDLEPSRLVEFRIHGVSPEFVQGMTDAGLRDLSPGRLVEFRIHGVSPEFVQGLADAGLSELSQGRLVEFRIHGVSPEFVAAMTRSGLKDLSPSRLVEFRIHGVSGEFVRGLVDAGLEDLSPARLVEFRIHGVTPKFVRALGEVGFDRLSPSRLVQFRIHGVTPDFVRRAQERYGNDLTASDLIDLRIHNRL
ncbi:hypothetical protein ABI59_05340 [Acidobacteria bacterium Mor1]|nr:hypothetical protein ABI59_05340 [Acidobacteria bacterium Mor1]